MQLLPRAPGRRSPSKFGWLLLLTFLSLPLGNACSDGSPEEGDEPGSAGATGEVGSGGKTDTSSGGSKGEKPDRQPETDLGGTGGLGDPPMNLGGMGADGFPIDMGPAGSGGVIDVGSGGSSPDLQWVGPCAEEDTVLGTPLEETEETCCGCTCADARWSCSQDTCTSEDGLVPELAPEAGFLEIAGGDYRVEGQDRVSPNHRLFYTFHPATESDAPLLLFFNGGPGSPTTAFLFAFNTAPKTLDPRIAEDAEIKDNPHDFSRAFHLLYVDAPGTGFSYPQELEDGRNVPHQLDMPRDAAEFLKFLLFFLEKHPALWDAPIGLVGESYGGTRAAIMMDLVEHFERLTDPAGAYYDEPLYEALLAHFQRRFPDLEDGVPDLETVREQFGHQVLIQPALLGSVQMDANPRDAPCVGTLCASRYDQDCVADPEFSQCDQEQGTLDPLFQDVILRLTRVEILEQMLGVDVPSITWLRRCGPSPLEAESQLPFSPQRSLTVYPGSQTWRDPLVTLKTVPSLVHTKTFITHAAHDVVIDSMKIVAAIHRVIVDPSMIELRADLPSAQERPGEIFLRLTDADATVRFPHYDAGHVVTMNAPGEFYDDLVDWWASD